MPYRYLYSLNLLDRRKRRTELCWSIIFFPRKLRRNFSLFTFGAQKHVFLFFRWRARVSPTFFPSFSSLIFFSAAFPRGIIRGKRGGDISGMRRRRKKRRRKSRKERFKGKRGNPPPPPPCLLPPPALAWEDRGAGGFVPQFFETIPFAYRRRPNKGAANFRSVAAADDEKIFAIPDEASRA